MTLSPEHQADALESELGDDDRVFLDELAEAITRRRLSTPAIFFLESVKPLNLVASSTMVFFRPILQALWRNPIAYDRAANLLEKRAAIELLLRRLEAKA